MWLLNILIFILLINDAENVKQKLPDIERWNNYVRRLGDVDSKNYSVNENGVYCKVCEKYGKPRRYALFKKHHNDGKMHRTKLSMIFLDNNKHNIKKII
ncbi:unnamed protein product [Meloidogyne enterolobii]|uniref:Uncharacterized protein n=1 Tax=Meloidogyne enterolobii TaxID=390850 RepID=A0ACB1AI82_MELEN